MTKKNEQSAEKKDSLYQEARTDSVQFLESRRKAVVKIARRYYLDPQDLYQEAYEILLKCLRDFEPTKKNSDGEIVTQSFTTFFGARLENKAIAMRNNHPEYQARQAFVEKMSPDEKQRFRDNPNLLVQHIDQEGPAAEYLMNEMSLEQEKEKDVKTRIARDSFFEHVLEGIIAREKDPKKRTALMHIKVGGIYNFQDMAYHFGVSDSRASQVLNELMDAFYTQRLIDGDIKGVFKDFKKVRFSGKRAKAIVESAFGYDLAHCEEIKQNFLELYPETTEDFVSQAARVDQTTSHAAQQTYDAPVYKEVVSDTENEKYPLQGVEVRQIRDLTFMDDVSFRSPSNAKKFEAFAATHIFDDGKFPAVITEEGLVLDGNRRLRRALAEGVDNYMCVVRKVSDKKEAQLLRVTINMRLLEKDAKIEIYHAIGALNALGTSQVLIAGCVGISRPNVSVYVKVLDKASAQVRALFEDGFMKITNASICADLSAKAQDDVASFIRHNGEVWAKGEKFNQLMAAAVSDAKLQEFIQKNGDSQSALLQTQKTANVDTSALPGKTQYTAMLEKRVAAYETELKDQEIWQKRREAIVSQQAEQLKDAEEQISMLQKELDAAELTKFGTPDAIEKELKQLRAFYRVTERLSGATHALGSVAKDVGRLQLTRKQSLELKTLYERLDEAHNHVRVSLVK